MGPVRIVGVALGVLAISGCASMGTKSTVKRLESQVGLLDERVTQLERLSTQQPIGGGAMLEGEPFGAEPASSWKEPAPAKPSAKRAKRVSFKPATREVQHALKSAGFYQGLVDGKLGPQTREAVREFQRINGLKVDGVVGRQTWGKLGAYADASAASGELNAAEILK